MRVQTDRLECVRCILVWVTKLAGLTAVACATVTSEPRHASLLRYIDTAHEQLQRCLILALRPSEHAHTPGLTRAFLDPVCGLRAQAELNVLYGAAKNEVRFERGTTMYLDWYKRDWIQVMGLLAAAEVLTNEQSDKLQKQLAELDRITAKLRR